MTRGNIFGTLFGISKLYVCLLLIEIEIYFGLIVILSDVCLEWILQGMDETNKRII